MFFWFLMKANIVNLLEKKSSFFIIFVRFTWGKTKYFKDFSLLNISDLNVQMWAVKPSEEGIEQGVILRVWDMSNSDKETIISSPLVIQSAQNTTHIETNISDIKLMSNKIKTTVGHNRMQTFRLTFKTK